MHVAFDLPLEAVRNYRVNSTEYASELDVQYEYSRSSRLREPQESTVSTLQAAEAASSVAHLNARDCITNGMAPQAPQHGCTRCISLLISTAIILRGRKENGTVCITMLRSSLPSQPYLNCPLRFRCRYLDLRLADSPFK